MKPRPAPTKPAQNGFRSAWLVPALLTVLSQNPKAPLIKVIEWERKIRHSAHKDNSQRLLYAEWLKKKGLTDREAEIRRDIEVIHKGGEIGAWHTANYETCADSQLQVIDIKLGRWLIEPK